MGKHIKLFVTESWLLLVAAIVFGLGLATLHGALAEKIRQNEIAKFNKLASTMITDANDFTIAGTVAVDVGKGKTIETEIKKGVDAEGNTVGWALLAAFVAVSALIGDSESAPRNVRLFQLAYLTGFIGYGLIIRPLVSGRIRIDRSWSWLLGAVVMRLALIGAVPNDDVYRYLWEGRVQQAGFNPYVLPPEASELTDLRDAAWESINHPEYTAIYGPLAQIEFRLVAGVWPSIRAFKLVHVLLDLGHLFFEQRQAVVSLICVIKIQVEYAGQFINKAIHHCRRNILPAFFAYNSLDTPKQLLDNLSGSLAVVGGNIIAVTSQRLVNLLLIQNSFVHIDTPNSLAR